VRAGAGVEPQANCWLADEAAISTRPHYSHQEKDHKDHDECIPTLTIATGASSAGIGVKCDNDRLLKDAHGGWGDAGTGEELRGRSSRWQK